MSFLRNSTDQSSSLDSTIASTKKLRDQLAEPILNNIEHEYKNLKVLTKKNLIEAYTKLSYFHNAKSNTTTLGSAIGTNDGAMLLSFILFPISIAWAIRDEINDYDYKIKQTMAKIQQLLGQYIGEVESYNEFLKKNQCGLDDQALKKGLIKLGEFSGHSRNEYKTIDDLVPLTEVVTKLNSLVNQNTLKMKSEVLAKCHQQALEQIITLRKIIEQKTEQKKDSETVKENRVISLR
jgi:hypothetical protein